MNINRIPEKANGLFPRELVSIVYECTGGDGYVGYRQLEEILDGHPNLNYVQLNLSLDEYLKKYSYYLKFSGCENKKVGIRTRENIMPNITMRLNGFGTLWAYIKDSQYVELAKMARPEIWTLDRNYPYIILKSYLNATFKRLSSQKRILVDEKSGDAIFNTGLITENDEYIYAYFRMNIEDEFDPVCWYLDSFITKKSCTYDYLSNVFESRFPAKAADYFFEYDSHGNKIKNNISNFIYIPDESNQVIGNWNHICLERIGRFPLDYLKLIVSIIPELKKDLEKVYFLDENNPIRKKYMRDLADNLKQNNLLYNSFIHCVEVAMEHTFNLARRNYKIVVPMYYPTVDGVNMLFPLWLQDSTGSPDVALVVLRDRDNQLIAKTILPMNLAYADSRVIAPVDTAWLRSCLR